MRKVSLIPDRRSGLPAMLVYVYVRRVCRVHEIPDVGPGVVTTRHKIALRQKFSKLPSLYSADATAVIAHKPLYIQQFRI